MTAYILEPIQPFGESNTFIKADPEFVYIKGKYVEEIGRRSRLVLIKLTVLIGRKLSSRRT